MWQIIDTKMLYLYFLKKLKIHVSYKVYLSPIKCHKSSKKSLEQGKEKNYIQSNKNTS